MSKPFTREERDALIARARATEARIFPPEGQPKPTPRQSDRLLDQLYEQLAEYSDRLPRVVLSACPFTGAPLKRAFDPFDLGGFWWHKDRTFTPGEPRTPPSFRVLLGAVDLNGRKPAETREQVLAGPDVPFVVPRLLELDGMVAVLHRVPMSTGDVCYPVGYFSQQTFDPEDLHQHWTRPDLVFTDPDGEEGWTFSTDPWDFDLGPWIASGRLRWIRPGEGKPVVVGAESGEACPYVGLPGDRRPQLLGGGERVLDELPTGDPPDPFGD